MHETLLVPVLIYDSTTTLWKEKERSRNRVVQIDNLKGFLGIRRMARVPNARIREVCGVTKGLDEWIYEDIFLWFGHVERMETNRISKRVRESM